MKIRKKRKKDIGSRNNNMKSILILVMLICIIIAMITYYLYAYEHKHGKSYFEDIKLVSYKLSDYVDVKGDVVYLKNINENIGTRFSDFQKEILDHNDVVSVNIHKELNGKILSIMINYTLRDNLINYDKFITLNVDVKNDKVLTNGDMLEMIDVSYKDIAINIFDEYVRLSSDREGNVVDSITDEELGVKEFNENSEKYIIRIREKLPDIMSLYIENDIVYYVLDIDEIYEVCYYTDKNRISSIKKELGKI